MALAEVVVLVRRRAPRRTRLAFVGRAVHHAELRYAEASRAHLLEDLDIVDLLVGDGTVQQLSR